MATQTTSCCLCLAMESRRWLWLLSFLTIIVLRLLTPTSHSINTDSDLHTLLSFKSLITKDPFGALSSWSAISNSTSNDTHGSCRWNGVTCSDRLHPGRVTALRLRGLGLAGAIPPLLGNLTGLRALDLSDNKLEGDIPPSLGNCFALRSLNLSANFLSGTIPPALGHLSNLVILNIHHNDIIGSIPSSLQNLTILTMFSIGMNSMHGQIPPWVGNLTTVTDLNFGGNGFSGHIPQSLAKLTNLVSLRMQLNKLEGVIPPLLFNISSIETFNLGSNQLSGYLPLDIGFELPNLKEFAVFYNQIEGPIPPSLSNISLLEKLILHGNRFRGQIPPNSGSNGLLKVFELGNNKLQATEPRDWDFFTSLANCSNLGYINLQLNNLSGILPNIVANLSQELQWFQMGGNKISGSIPSGIGRLHKVTVLELADNLFTGTIPTDIGKLSSLHRILLFQNAFHGEIPSSLANLTQLNELLLFSNDLEGSIPRLGNISVITSIDLSYNRLSGQIPQEILSMASLTKLLNLSNNELSGPISPQIGHLVNLATVDLSANKLSGEIPHTLGSCVELQFLYLQGNLLQGQIPADLNALRGLEVLNLSNNYLSGPIPEFLGNFQVLKHLDLSANHLYGPVPDMGIFRNASAVSLASNSMLCGGPLFFQLPVCSSQAPHKPSQCQPPYIFIFCTVGALVIVVFIATFYFVKKLRTKPSDADQEDTTFVDEIHQKISYAQLYVATDSFSSENLIGCGSFGSVYKGILTSGMNLITVAVKVFKLQQRGATRSFITECNALKSIQHRKLVKVITVCDSCNHNGDEFKALVLEFISNGNMDDWLHPCTVATDNLHGMLSLMQRLNIALDVAEALEYLHYHVEPPIVHRDIKPSNILLDEDMVAHVSDFGLAKIVKVEASGQYLGETSSVGIKGTIGYLAPEYGAGAEVSVEGDVHSYGVLLLEILTGRRPTDALFDGTTSLPKFVEMAYPDKLLGIVDATIARCGDTQEMIELFIAPVARLGLACCRDSASHRMRMDEVVKELVAVKKAWAAHLSNIH